MGLKAHKMTKALFTHTKNTFALIGHACTPPLCTHVYQDLSHMSCPYLCGSKVGMKRHKDAMRDLETYRCCCIPPSQPPPAHSLDLCVLKMRLLSTCEVVVNSTATFQRGCHGNRTKTETMTAAYAAAVGLCD